LSVPAGLADFWQVSSRSNGDIEAQKTQDLYYIRNWSIIVLQTVPAVLGDAAIASRPPAL
jgi:lipopolysaccharide/colanic/teichoic acid biosynthesis glycosyltransferase